MCPGCGGQAAQCQADVHIGRAGQVIVLQNRNERGGQLVGLRLALLGRQVGGPVYQRLHGGHGVGTLHNDVPHGLAVGTAAGYPCRIDGLGQDLRRNRALFKAAVGAAGAQKLQHIHVGTLPYII